MYDNSYCTVFDGMCHWFLSFRGSVENRVILLYYHA